MLWRPNAENVPYDLMFLEIAILPSPAGQNFEHFDRQVALHIFFEALVFDKYF